MVRCGGGGVCVGGGGGGVDYSTPNRPANHPELDNVCLIPQTAQTLTTYSMLVKQY